MQLPWKYQLRAMLSSTVKPTLAGKGSGLRHSLEIFSSRTSFFQPFKIPWIVNKHLSARIKVVYTPLQKKHLRHCKTHCQEIVQGLVILWANKWLQIWAEKSNFKANKRNIQQIVYSNCGIKITVINKRQKGIAWWGRWMKLRRNLCKWYFLVHMESIKVSDELSTSTDWHGVSVIPLKYLNRFSIDILSIRKYHVCLLRWLKCCGVKFLAGWAEELYHASSFY